MHVAAEARVLLHGFLVVERLKSVCEERQGSGVIFCVTETEEDAILRVGTGSDGGKLGKRST